MGKPAILSIKILTDASKAQKGLDQAAGKMDKFKAGLGKAAIPAAAIAGGLTVLGKKAVDAASDLNETQTKVEQIFGPAGAKVIEDYGKTAADSIGQSQQAALDAASQFGTFGKAAGLSGKDLAGFSTQLTGLSSDLASFYNTSPEEAANALAAGLRGESEPLRKYGVLLDDATLRQKAMEKGITKTTKKALTPQQKVLAAQAVILDQTKDAQGDFQKTSDGLANSQRTMTARWQDAQAALGQMLLPAVTKVTQAFAGMVGWISDNTKTVGILVGLIGGLAAAILGLNVALKIYKATQTAVTAATKLFGIVSKAAWLSNPITLVVIAIIAVVAAIVLLWNKCEAFRNVVLAVWNAIKVGAEATWNAIKAAVSAVITWATSFIKTFMGVVMKVWNAIKAAGIAIWNVLKAVIRGVIAAIKAYITAYKTVVLAVWNAIKASAQAVWNGIKRVVQVVVAGIKAYILAYKTVVLFVWNAIKSAAVTAWNGIKSLISTVVEKIKGPLRSLRDFAKGIWETIKSGATTAFEKIRDVGKTALDALLWPIKKIQDAFDTLKNGIQHVIDALKNIKVPKIKLPSLSDLNPFKSTPPPSPASPPSAPTYVGAPRGLSSRAVSASSGGAGINININGALDPVAVARQIRRILADDDRRRRGPRITVNAR